MTLKQLIYRKEIKDITMANPIVIDVEIESDAESHLFGKYYITASYDNSQASPLMLDSEPKDVCNFLLKAESISDLIESNIDEIVKITACAINLANWTFVISDVVPILNATLSREEIDCCTNGDDWFNYSNVWRILNWKAQGTDTIYEYENKSDLIRFVTQIFVCDWIQSSNGIRLALGERTSINKIDDIWDYISNPNFDDAIKNGSNIRKYSQEHC